MWSSLLFVLLSVTENNRRQIVYVHLYRYCITILRKFAYPLFYSKITKNTTGRRIVTSFIPEGIGRGFRKMEKAQ